MNDLTHVTAEKIETPPHDPLHPSPSRTTTPGSFSPDLPKKPRQIEKPTPRIGGEILRAQEKEYHRQKDNLIKIGLYAQEMGIDFKVGKDGKVISVNIPEDLIPVPETEKSEISELKEKIASYERELLALKGGLSSQNTNPSPMVNPLVSNENIASLEKSPVQENKILRPSLVTPTRTGDELRESWNKKREEDEKKKLEQTKNATLELTKKHKEMFDRDPDSYRKTYENKKFVYGDPNEAVVQTILGEGATREKTDAELIEEEKAKVTSTIDMSSLHYSPSTQGNILGTLDRHDMTQAGKVLSEPGALRSQEKKDKVGMLEKTLDGLWDKKWWWTHPIIVAVIGTASYIAHDKSLTSLPTDKPEHSVEDLEKKDAWKNLLQKEDRDILTTLPTLSSEEILRTYVPEASFKLGNPSFLPSLLDLNVHTIVKSEESISLLENEERSQLSKLIVSLVRVSQAIDGTTGKELPIPPQMKLRDFFDMIENKIKNAQ